MGLPDSRDIEPIREDHSTEGYNNEPVFLANNVEENEIMQINGNEPDINNGYLLLHDLGDEMPADDADSSGSDEEDENEFELDNMEETVESIQPQGFPSIVSADSELETQVWSSPRPQDTIELNTEKTQQILNAMSKFSLPNVPDWANKIDPTELIERIRNKELSAGTSKK